MDTMIVSAERSHCLELILGLGQYTIPNVSEIMLKTIQQYLTEDLDEPQVAPVEAEAGEPVTNLFAAESPRLKSGDESVHCIEVFLKYYISTADM